ncbi:S8 family serine peptidase [Ureibacillus thermosphaericus]|uniref:S8 family serine peptidase n=1 Tax=Ureibacillus thermosphaericus TaxID=51173 RepID=UPI0030C96A23
MYFFNKKIKAFIVVIAIMSLICFISIATKSNEFKHEFYSKLIENRNPNIELKVAILDSGISPDLNLNLPIYRYNFTDSEDGSDNTGHGTAITNLIIETAQLSSTNTKIYSLKVLDDKGYGKNESVIEAIEWAIKNKMNVINISFGFKHENEKLKQKIEEAINEGIIIIASGGNTFGFSTEYPAAFENVIAVSALDGNKIADYAAKDNIDYFTNGTNIHVDLGLDTRIESGSSIATARVTALVILLLQNDNNLLNEKNVYYSLNKKLNKYANLVEGESIS